MAVTARRQLVWRVAVAGGATYLLGMLVCLAVNASWKAYLGVAFGWADVLECVYGPAITLASVAILWGGFWVSVEVVQRLTALMTTLREP